MLTGAQLKLLLASHGIRLSKRLGQHYLIDPQAIRRIIEACELSSRDTVVEIGAGLGALTEPLAGCAGRVIAVDVDRRICALLTERLSSVPNAEVACQDILAFRWDQHPGAVAVGAIPYHITSPILVSLFDSRQAIARAVLVLQAEVAERLCAKPGTKAYGRLTVLAQYGWDVSRCFTIPQRAFFPQPEVASCCIRLLSRPKPPVAVQDEAAFFRLVKAAFSQRRKTLANCLKTLAPTAEIARVIARVKLPPSVRGETLGLEEFSALSNAFARIK